MRILHVVPSYLPAVRYGGPIFVIHSLCKALSKRGHDVHVFTTNVDGESDSAVPTWGVVPLDGVNINYFPSRLFRRIFWSPAMGRALSRNVSSFDIVHLHSAYLWPTWAGASAARRANVPYITSPHGMLVRSLIARRSTVAKTIWINAVERRNVEAASAVYLTSWLEAQELKAFGWTLPHLSVFSLGIDDPDRTTELATSPDVRHIIRLGPFILYLGRLSWKKGLDRLLHAFAATAGTRLVIAGTDDESLAGSLMTLARTLEIDRRVSILPRTVTGADKERLFAACSMFVLSSYSENFGNTVLEAMRRAVPVIVTPEVGAGELVRICGGGLVSQGDPPSLSAAISRLVADPALAKAMGEAGRRYAIDHCSWDAVATKMEELYKCARDI